MRHKHYDVIVAFAEGRAVQYRADASGTWRDWVDDLCSPPFNSRSHTEYRIKPQKAWRWVVSPVDNPNDLTITHNHFNNPEQVHKDFNAVNWSVHQPVLSTEKEMWCPSFLLQSNALALMAGTFVILSCPPTFCVKESNMLQKQHNMSGSPKHCELCLSPSDTCLTCSLDNIIQVSKEKCVPAKKINVSSGEDCFWTEDELCAVY